MTLEENCTEVLRKEFEAHELLNEIVEENDEVDVEQAFSESINEAISNVNSENRELEILFLGFKIAQAIESERLMKKTGEKIEEMTGEDLGV